MCDRAALPAAVPTDLGGERGTLDQHRRRSLHPLWAVGTGYPLPTGTTASEGAEHAGQVHLLPGKPAAYGAPEAQGELFSARERQCDNGKSQA